MNDPTSDYQAAPAAAWGQLATTRGRRETRSARASDLTVPTGGSGIAQEFEGLPQTSRQAVASRRTRSKGSAPGGHRAEANPAQRDLIRRTVGRAIEHADEMIRAAETGDPIALSNAGFDLWRCLKELWGLRKQREPNWCDLLNMLEGALAGETYEAFRSDQCYLIRQVLVDHLKPWVVEDEDVRAAIALVGRAGLDPWKGISSY